MRTQVLHCRCPGGRAGPWARGAPVCVQIRLPKCHTGITGSPTTALPLHHLLPPPSWAPDELSGESPGGTPASSGGGQTPTEATVMIVGCPNVNETSKRRSRSSSRPPRASFRPPCAPSPCGSRRGCGGTPLATRARHLVPRSSAVAVSSPVLRLCPIESPGGFSWPVARVLTLPTLAVQVLPSPGLAAHSGGALCSEVCLFFLWPLPVLLV